jgi:hypothetical protein
MEEPVALFSTVRLRVAAVVGALCALLAVSCTVMASKASAAAPPSSTDVMFVFDTSGSMGSELEEAKEKIQSVMSALSATLPNVAFGVSRVEDVPDWDGGPEFLGTQPSESEFEANPEKAWQLGQPISTDQSASTTAINNLTIDDGGDLPESYGRALYEADTNPSVGWRPGARHEIVLIADNVPHGENLDEGLPESEWIANPFDTGKEAPAKAGIPGSLWAPGTDLQIVPVAKQLAADGKPLEEVEFFGGETGYLHYWEYWAGLSGGTALEGTSGELASRLTTLIEGGACGAKCPHATTAQVICNLVIATASDTCTATVADAAAAGPTNPTGAVGFASASGGVFSAGTSCNLVPTPLSSNTSSCAVTYLPPTTASLAPAITATYAGDAAHTGSSAKTTYPAASELARDVTLATLGTIHDGEAEIPIDCGFPCLMAGELFTGPSLANLASVGAVTVELAETATTKHKKKSHKPKLLGKGSAKLSQAGKGKLIIKFSQKYKHALSKVKGSIHLTVKLTTKTLNGTLVGKETEHVTLKPKKAKKKKKHH